MGNARESAKKPGPFHILLIQGDPVYAVRLAKILQKVKNPIFSSETACSLESGLQRLAKGGIQAVLLDLVLPDSRGLSGLVKVHSQAPQIPMVTLTTRNDPRIAVGAVRRGAQDCLFKGHADERVLPRVLHYAIERKLAAEAKRIQDRTLDSLSDPVLIADVHTHDCPVTYVNRAFERVTGYSAKEVVGHPWQFLKTEEAYQDILVELQTSLSEKKEVRRILPFYRKDKTLFWSDLHLVPLRNEGGLVTHTICLQTDITDQKNTEEELRRTRDEVIENEKKAFAGRISAGVAHEIRNPLNIALMVTEKLHGELKGNEMKRQYTAASLKALERISKLIGDLLDSARSPKLVVCQADPWKVMLRALNTVKPQAKERDVHIVKRVLRPIPLLRMDEQRMEQVWLNLLLNAIEAMPRGGKLNVDMEKSDRWLVSRVQDQGVGIRQENLLNIFEPFYSTKKVGTGLGLTISASIVASHGGRIEVNSKRGKGTTMSVKLPLEG